MLYLGHDGNFVDMPGEEQVSADSDTLILLTLGNI
jgi:hypothetical protein